MRIVTGLETMIQQLSETGIDTEVISDAIEYIKVLEDRLEDLGEEL
jgi:hypothetical protein